jgi:hypothetical protein
MKLPSRISRFVDACVVPMINTDRHKYPITPGRLKNFYLDLAARDFLEARNLLKEKGFSTREIARLFKTPSRLMRMSYYLLDGAKMSGISGAGRLELLNFILDLIRELKQSDECGGDGLNLIWSEKKAETRLTDIDFTTADVTVYKRVHQLAALLRSYTDGVFFVPHDVGMEMHGPYEWKNMKVFVRDFFNLNPTYLWKETREMPCSEFSIITLYKPDFKIHFDAFNNTYIDSGSYIDDCLGFALFLNGRLISLTRADPLFTLCLQILSRVTKKVEAMTEKERASKYFQCFWLRFKEMREAASLDWHPPRETLDRLQKTPIPPLPEVPLTEENARRFFSFADSV